MMRRFSRRHRGSANDAPINGETCVRADCSNRESSQLRSLEVSARRSKTAEVPVELCGDRKR